MLYGILILVIVIYAVIVYNSLILLKNNVSKAWANIDVLLKQRHDELPKLIDICKQYMQHEQSTLEKVTQARMRVESAREQQDIARLGDAESSLSTNLGSLFALAENYPDLKANQSFSALQSRITGLENALADRREFYNDSVNLNNVRVQQFPELIVAKLFGFNQLNLLQFSHAELSDVDVGKRFTS